MPRDIFKVGWKMEAAEGLSTINYAKLKTLCSIVICFIPRDIYSGSKTMTIDL